MSRATDYRVSMLKPEDYRAAADVFAGSLHHGPLSDERWESTRPSWVDQRVFGALTGDTVVGTAQSYPSRLALPGGSLPMAMVSRVGVRADHTRRGLLSGLLRALLESISEPLATLRATEATIYGRFGFGVATRGRTVVIDRRTGRFGESVPAGGDIRILGLEEAIAELPDVYERIGLRRPGVLARPRAWWPGLRRVAPTPDTPMIGAVYTGMDGVDDGFVVYHVQERGFECVLHVHDLHAGSPTAWAALWRFVCGVDLPVEVRARQRPVDEPLELLFADYRAVRTEDMGDEIWLRLVDVPAALNGRAYGDAEPVVIRVRDRVLPANEGCYRIGRDGAERGDGRPDLELDVSDLARVYLGDVRMSALAATGRVSVAEPAAVARADWLFASDEVPWSGTFF